MTHFTSTNQGFSDPRLAAMYCPLPISGLDYEVCLFPVSRQDEGIFLSAGFSLPQSLLDINSSTRFYEGYREHDINHDICLTFRQKRHSGGAIIDEVVDIMVDELIQSYQIISLFGWPTGTSGSKLQIRYGVSRNDNLSPLGIASTECITGTSEKQFLWNPETEKRVQLCLKTWMEVYHNAVPQAKAFKAVRYRRLIAGFIAWQRAMTHSNAEERIHQLARGIDAVLWSGGRADEFAHRGGQLFQQIDGEDAKLVFRDIYNLRSKIEHVEDWKSAKRFGEMTMEEAKCVAVKRLIQAEKVCAELLIGLLGGSLPLSAFVDDHSSHRLWLKAQTQVNPKLSLAFYQNNDFQTGAQNTAKVLEMISSTPDINS